MLTNESTVAVGMRSRSAARFDSDSCRMTESAGRQRWIVSNRNSAVMVPSTVAGSVAGWGSGSGRDDAVNPSASTAHAAPGSVSTLSPTGARAASAGSSVSCTSRVPAGRIAPGSYG